jgi:DNA replication initiation complex subunit (GINS family)
MPDPFTLLLEWRRSESAGRSLAKLPFDYYASTAHYLAELRRSYEGDLRENPSGRKGELSRQTYQRASQVARDILESRLQKLLSLAFQASVGGSRDVPNALPEERQIFDRMLSIFLEYRGAVAPYLEPSGGPAAAPQPPARPASPATATAPPARASAPAPPARAATAPSPLAYVRILKDSPPIEIGSETVDLRADDIVSLPAETARLLVQGKVAEPVAAAPLGPAP